MIPAVNKPLPSASRAAPPSELAADLRHLGSDGEAQPAVQRERGGVAALDAGHHDVLAGLPGSFDQCRHQPPGHAAPTRFLTQTEIHVHAQAVC